MQVSYSIHQRLFQGVVIQLVQIGSKIFLGAVQKPIKKQQPRDNDYDYDYLIDLY